MEKSRTVVLALFVIGAITLWYTHDTLLLVFAGLLVALVFRSISKPLTKLMRLPDAWAVWLGVSAVLGTCVLAVALLGNAVALQLEALRKTLPMALHDVIAHLSGTPFGQWLAGYAPYFPAFVPDTAQVLARATGIVSGALGMVVAVLIVVFVGIAIALEPRLYLNGFVQLFPATRRERIRDVLFEIGATLRTWMIARLFTMAVTGALVTLGLTLLHVPLAAALGVLAAALAFIPNVGAFVAAAPAVILAFAVSPGTALAVAVMYVSVHIVDDFIVGPVVERQVVKLPPVVTLAGQIVLGIADGAIGVMLAAPLVAASLVAVRRFWVEDVADVAS